jgi:hypothetical protein
LDICEGNDWNLNGSCDEPLVLTGIDIDGDGLDNLFDSLNSVTNVKGTSYLMGNGGSIAGDATPGTKATVQKQTMGQIDRDWRYVGVVLPVNIVSFTATAQIKAVTLNWSVITQTAIEKFEIERSLGNSTYVIAGTITEAVAINELQSFSFIDNSASVDNEVLYYRLKITGKNGAVKYSNVLVLRNNASKNAVTIMPNPVNDYVTIRFTADKESEVTIRLVSVNGKTVLIQNRHAAKGSNTIMLNNLSAYGAGMYSMQIAINGEIITQRLMISK